MTSYIGVDVGKKSLHIYLPIADKSIEITNNQQGLAKLLSCCVEYYQHLSDIIIAFEPTGGYERELKKFLKLNKVNFVTVHPNKVRSYAKAKGWLAKTDLIDSKLLSEYATVFSLPVKQDYNCKSQEDLHYFIQRREQLIAFKNQEIARLENNYNKVVIKSIKSHINQLDKQLIQVQKSIEELCNNDLAIKDKVSKLTSIPGVGIVAATTAICEIPQLGNIEFSQLTALVGIAPYARESGGYKGKRSIFAGRGNLRKVLYMAAVASLRCNIKLKEFYDRLLANHKPAKVALVAVMRKLLGFMHAVVKNNSFWNNNYVTP